MPYKDPMKARAYREAHKEERNKASRELYIKSPERREYLKNYLQRWRHKRGILPKSLKVPNPTQTIIEPIEHKELITNTPNSEPVETFSLEGLPHLIAWKSKLKQFEPFFVVPVKKPTWQKCENIIHSDFVVCGLDPMKRRCQEVPFWICRNLQEEKT